MKKNLVFIALILMALVSCSKLQSNEKKFLKGMQSEDYEESSQAFNDFCEWMENDSETMTHDFNLMREKMGLKVVSSGDGIVRCYSWETTGSDSLHIYANITQWKLGDNFAAFSGPIDQLLAGRKTRIKNYHFVAHNIDSIIDVTLGQNKVYLILQSYINKYGMRRAFVSAGTIIGIKLSLLPSFFDGTDIAGNNEFRDNGDVPIDKLFKWDEKTGRLYAYQTDDENNLIPGKYTVFQLGNDRFTRLPDEE
ncbi:MAG: hypothetical protein IKX18_06355 [Muribaculaceae bacterium]|nr:hypothetical protein [Muribaculaceae bacterium]